MSWDLRRSSVDYFQIIEPTLHYFCNRISAVEKLTLAAIESQSPWYFWSFSINALSSIFIFDFISLASFRRSLLSKLNCILALFDILWGEFSGTNFFLSKILFVEFWGENLGADLQSSAEFYKFLNPFPSSKYRFWIIFSSPICSVLKLSNFPIFPLGFSDYLILKGYSVKLFEYWIFVIEILLISSSGRIMWVL